MKNRKEIMNYLIFGVLTTIINIGSFWIINPFMDYKLATTFAWILSVIFAFITNKLYVFSSQNKSKSIVLKEFVSFLFFRLLSYVLDLAAMIFLIDYLNIEDMVAKIFANIIVVVVNYFASKYIIFTTSSK